MRQDEVAQIRLLRLAIDRNSILTPPNEPTFYMMSVVPSGEVVQGGYLVDPLQCLKLVQKSGFKVELLLTALVCAARNLNMCGR
jgi:hypothetical protein